MGWRFVDVLVPNSAELAGRPQVRHPILAAMSAGVMGCIVLGIVGAIVAGMMNTSPDIATVLLVLWVGVMFLAPMMLGPTERMLGTRGPLVVRLALVPALALTVGAAARVDVTQFVQGHLDGSGDIHAVGMGWIFGTFLGGTALAVGLLVAWGIHRRERPWLDRVLERSVAAMGALVLALVLTDVVSIAWHPQWATRDFGIVGPWMLAALASVAIAAYTVHVRNRQVAPWSTPATWRAAHIGEGRWIHFHDGAALRQASPFFERWQGDVVVVPTAGGDTGPFRGDGAPADGWVIPGTVASLTDAVRVSRAAGTALALAVLTAGAAPLVVTLAMGLFRPW